MNLSNGQATFPQGGDSGAGGTLGGAANAGPAHPLTVGAVGFGAGWSTEDSMAASIIRLECENDELRARVAVLEEEQRILARKYAPRLTDEELREEVRHKYEADRVGGHEWGNI
jgi:hypothetical protein